MDIIQKAAGWAAKYGNVLTASAETKFPWLYKGAVGGIEHVISVDSGAYYLELWRSGEGSYYASTGAAIKQMPGLAKGAALDEALDKFFALTSKLAKSVAKKGKTYRDRQGVTQPSARKRSPFKKADNPNRHPHAATPGARKPSFHSHEGGAFGSPPHIHHGKPNPPFEKGVTDDPSKGPYGGPKPVRKAHAIRKKIIELVDPEIGPSFSVGHIKPSDLSPESSVSKLIKAILHHDLDVQTPASKPKFDGQEKKDIVGLSGGMGKPPRVKQGFGDPARVNKPVGRGPRLITNIEGGRSMAGGGTSPVKPASGPGSPVGYGSTGQPQYSYKRAARKARGPVFQPKKPPQTYQSSQGFSGRRMGGPGSKSPAVAVPSRPSTRFGKACSPCREVAKAVREVNKHSTPKPHPHGQPRQYPKPEEGYYTPQEQAERDEQIGAAFDAIGEYRKPGGGWRKNPKPIKRVNKVVATPGGVQKRQ